MKPPLIMDAGYLSVASSPVLRVRKQVTERSTSPDLAVVGGPEQTSSDDCRDPKERCAHTRPLATLPKDMR